MNENIYLHAVSNGGSKDFDLKSQLKSLKSSLELGSLLSARMKGYTEGKNFSGLDYISLCDYSKRNIGRENRPNYNAYNAYIINSISFGFDKSNLDVIIPTLVDISSDNKEGFNNMKFLGMQIERYSDLPDEVQVKDKISLDKLDLITFPVNEFLESKLYFTKSGEIKLLKKQIEEIDRVLIEYGYYVPVYDIDSKYELTEQNIEKLILKK